jgi:hypothetical protein
MDQGEFQRRVKVYLDADRPELSDTEGLAAVLSGQLFQYVREPPQPLDGESSSLRSLLDGERVLLYFSAGWVRSAPGYREVVGRAGEMLLRRVVDVEIDDPIGSALARYYGVTNTPTVIDTAEPGKRVTGAMPEEGLMASLGPMIATPDAE